MDVPTPKIVLNGKEPRILDPAIAAWLHCGIMA
jgi:hypothetical protein